MTAAEAKHWFLAIRRLPVDANTGSYYAQLAALRAWSATGGEVGSAVRVAVKAAVDGLGVLDGNNPRACLIAGADLVAIQKGGQAGQYTAEIDTFLALPALAVG